MCATLYVSSKIHPDIYSNRSFRARILLGINVMIISMIPLTLINISSVPIYFQYIPAILSIVSVILTYVYKLKETKSIYSVKEIAVGFFVFFSPIVVEILLMKFK